MRYLFFISLLVPVMLGAQEDSTYYYQRELSQLYQATFDSLRNTPRYKLIQERINAHIIKSDEYSSFNLFLEVADVKYDEFNTSIAAKGFPKLEGPIIRFGAGFTGKTKYMVYDFSFISSGIDQSSKKEDESVKVSFSSALMLDIGYDLLRSRRFNLYPYAGLSLRMAHITYDTPPVINPAYTDITDFLLNDRSIEAVSTKLGYQAGLGFDWALGNIDKNESFCMLFIKAGINNAFGAERFKMEDIKFTPGIEFGNWIVTVGVRLYSRS
jgi:hypothetical protein